jgi:putative Mg2+ transporter-C (MgtC) family protein
LKVIIKKIILVIFFVNDKNRIKNTIVRRNSMPRIEFVVRIIVAFLLGGLIGLERQYRQRMAGIKTNVLVCLGACLFVMFSNLTGGDQNARLAAQVVSGIGFLGGGVIIRDGFNIRGLTTAATLWCTAAVGVLTSEGHFFEAFSGAVMILIANVALRPIARRMYHDADDRKDEEVLYEIRVRCLQDNEFIIRSMLMELIKEGKLTLRNLESEDIDGVDKMIVSARITSAGRIDETMEKIVSSISRQEGVGSVGWEVLGIVEH